MQLALHVDEHICVDRMPPLVVGAHARFFQPVRFGQRIGGVVAHIGGGIGHHRQRCRRHVLIDPRICTGWNNQLRTLALRNLFVGHRDQTNFRARRRFHHVWGRV